MSGLIIQAIKLGFDLACLVILAKKFVFWLEKD